MWVVKCDERKCLLHRFWTLFLIHGLGFFFMIVLGSVSVVLKTHLKKKRLIWCFLSYLQPSEGSCLDSVGRPICSPVTLPLPPQGAPCMMLVARGISLSLENWLMTPTGDPGFLMGCLGVLEPDGGDWEMEGRASRCIFHKRVSGACLEVDHKDSATNGLLWSLTCLEHFLDRSSSCLPAPPL